MAFERTEGSRPARPMRRGRKKVCSFCVDRIDTIDYKDVPRLRKYVSERAKIIPRRVTGTCAFHQRALTVAIKRARHVALMPYVSDYLAASALPKCTEKSSLARDCSFCFASPPLGAAPAGACRSATAEGGS